MPEHRAHLGGDLGRPLLRLGFGGRLGDEGGEVEILARQRYNRRDMPLTESLYLLAIAALGGVGWLWTRLERAEFQAVSGVVSVLTTISALVVLGHDIGVAHARAVVPWDPQVNAALDAVTWGTVQLWLLWIAAQTYLGVLYLLSHYGLPRR